MSAPRGTGVLRWLVAYALSVLGDGVFYLALGWAAQRVAGPAETGVVMAAGSVPRAVLLLGGGVVADRFGPRGVVIGADAARCVLILGAAAALGIAAPGLWLLVAVALAFGVADALFLPAVGALPARIAPPEELGRIAGLRALALRLGGAAAAPVGGYALVLGGPAAAFAAAGLLFAASVPLLMTLRVRPLPDAPGVPGALDAPGAEAAPAHPAGAGRELREGLRYVRGHPLIGPLVLSGALSELGLNGPLNVGLVLLAAERGWGAAGLGWLVGAFGLGAGAGALLLAVTGRLPRPGLVHIATLVAAGAALGSVALAPSHGLAVAACGLGGLAGGVCGGLAYALIQTSAAPAYLGRVTAATSLTGLGLAPLCYPLVGAAIGAWGSAPVFLACGAFSCLGAVVCLAAPAVRRAELPRARGPRRTSAAGPVPDPPPAPAP
ncbi:MFS transporter [Streptomyces sp. WAC 06738]|uniref:MFS transporter n=1 Tax=Streptomyces sp. WAC 06738 TaxID=2203210 RepID=UPI000F7084B2|nr:MFS transporter [Streptomyces sp. WAC 06738]AZM45513.1 MFS transporter [Streptomyces sp. WAC 06738]